jgi:hypothetical protein
MKKKQSKRKRLVVQIEVTKMRDGQYYIHTEQLSDLVIPLTEFEKKSPPRKNPVSKEQLTQAIKDAKMYIQTLAKILRWDVTIKVKRY